MTFDAMDAKGRGLLARADLAALQTPETFETPFSRTEVDAVLRDLDADGSGAAERLRSSSRRRRQLF